MLVFDLSDLYKMYLTSNATDTFFRGGVGAGLRGGGGALIMWMTSVPLMLFITKFAASTS